MPRSKPSFLSKHWAYILLSGVVIVGVLIVTYKDKPREHDVKPFIPMQENFVLSGKEKKPKQEVEILPLVKKEKRIAIEKTSTQNNNSPMDTISISDSSIVVSAMQSKNVTIDSIKTEKTQELIAVPEIKKSNLVIYKFSNVESIKLYQSRLAESGIRLQITEIEYDKKYPDNIVQLAADLFVHDTFFKTINIADFKELRIQWETESTGITRIKSVSILDKFYMLKML